MARKWVASSHTDRHDHLHNDIDSIHSSVQSRLDGKLVTFIDEIKHDIFKMNCDF